ncbi:alpha/beta fold hydrolase [Flavobacteriaceae bacterium S356]|uniref:Alpha/beta fold hydrolase n=1 Tax=Asprobacillus argus TaxID=3076534 RepID=A0ABU3LDH4_9FLAO|nr:alpha/beta fold hydrolase [Flavobacteriaceae bacterium S356]
MNAKKKLSKKRRIIYLITVLTLVLGGIAMYMVVFVSDIPKTQPNVNHKPLNSLEISKDTLHDHLNNSLGIIETGRLVVKENREKVNSNLIELYFERFKTTAVKPFPPIFFLAGGPGSSSTRVGKTSYFFLFKELSKYADVVLLDQRGTGNSIPNLECRNSLDLPVDITENVQEEIMKDLLDKCRECADEFTYMGIDLSTYNSYESVLDIDAIRRALGYEEITLYGYSYGTELAQIYIKYFEGVVHKAILVGALAPDHGLKLPSDVQSQYVKMDSLMRLDKKLSKYIPNFLDLVKETHEQIKESPVDVKIPIKDAFGNNPSGAENALASVISIFRPTINMTLTETHLQMMISDRVGQDHAMERLPSLYYKMSQGNYREIGNSLRNFKRRRLPNALFFTANGASGYTDKLWKESFEQETSTIFSHFGISYGRYPEIYTTFKASKIDGLNAPVYGNTEVLFINGELDGRTPQRLADTIATRFPNNKKITVQNTGHNGLLSNAIMTGVIDFLKDSLTEDVRIKRKIAFRPPVPYMYSMSDTIYKEINLHGVTAGMDLYNSLSAEHIAKNDYLFDFSENSFTQLYHRLEEANRYKDAITILKFVIAKFPKSSVIHRSLAEAYLLTEDSGKAESHLKTALDLNFFDVRSQALFLKLQNQK